MEVIYIADKLDPRLQVFWDLPLRKMALAAEGAFVAEGRLVVERLLHCPYETTALLVSASKLDVATSLLKSATELRPHLAKCPVYCLPEEVFHQTVGFHFHSGIMASGSREIPASLREPVAGWFDAQREKAKREKVKVQKAKVQKATVQKATVQKATVPRETLLILPSMNSAENLGSIIRSGVGLGATGMIVTPQSADPLSRRVLRVSMGHALYFPIHTSHDWMGDLRRLRDSGFRLIGIENHPRMIPLKNAETYDRQALVFGNEFEGIEERVVDLMDEIVGIPMQPPVDSLNVGVAAAIALHHFAFGAPQK